MFLNESEVSTLPVDACYEKICCLLSVLHLTKTDAKPITNNRFSHNKHRLATSIPPTRSFS